MPTYNGHPSHAAWSVYCWLTSDETYYRLCLYWLRRAKTIRVAAHMVLQDLPPKNPDGVPFTRTNVIRTLSALKEDAL